MRIADAVWRLGAALPGQKYLERLRERGLPVVLYQPLRFLVDPARRTLTTQDRMIIARIESQRAQLAAQPERYYVAATPARTPVPARIVTTVAGSTPAEAEVRTSRWIAHTASVSEYWGTFLYQLAAASGTRSVLELGSRAGISACYLASAPGCRQLITIDGSEPMVGLARRHLAKVIDPSVQSRVIHALFDDGLDKALPEF